MIKSSTTNNIFDKHPTIDLTNTAVQYRRKNKKFISFYHEHKKKSELLFENEMKESNYNLKNNMKFELSNGLEVNKIDNNKLKNLKLEDYKKTTNFNRSKENKNSNLNSPQLLSPKREKIIVNNKELSFKINELYLDIENLNKPENQKDKPFQILTKYMIFLDNLTKNHVENKNNYFLSTVRKGNGVNVQNASMNGSNNVYNINYNLQAMKMQEALSKSVNIIINSYNTNNHQQNNHNYEKNKSKIFKEIQPNKTFEKIIDQVLRKVSYFTDKNVSICEDYVVNLISGEMTKFLNNNIEVLEDNKFVHQGSQIELPNIDSTKYNLRMNLSPIGERHELDSRESKRNYFDIIGGKMKDKINDKNNIHRDKNGNVYTLNNYDENDSSYKKDKTKKQYTFTKKQNSNNFDNYEDSDGFKSFENPLKNKTKTFYHQDRKNKVEEMKVEEDIKNKTMITKFNTKNLNNPFRKRSESNYTFDMKKLKDLDIKNVTGSVFSINENTTNRFYNNDNININKQTKVKDKFAPLITQSSNEDDINYHMDEINKNSNNSSSKKNKKEKKKKKKSNLNGNNKLSSSVIKNKNNLLENLNDYSKEGGSIFNQIIVDTEENNRTNKNSKSPNKKKKYKNNKNESLDEESESDNIEEEKSNNKTKNNKSKNNATKINNKGSKDKNKSATKNKSKTTSNSITKKNVKKTEKNKNSPTKKEVEEKLSTIHKTENDSNNIKILTELDNKKKTISKMGTINSKKLTTQGNDNNINKDLTNIIINSKENNTNINTQNNILNEEIIENNIEGNIKIEDEEENEEFINIQEDTIKFNIQDITKRSQRNKTKKKIILKNEFLPEEEEEKKIIEESKKIDEYYTDEDLNEKQITNENHINIITENSKKTLNYVKTNADKDSDRNDTYHNDPNYNPLLEMFNRKELTKDPNINKKRNRNEYKKLIKEKNSKIYTDEEYQKYKMKLKDFPDFNLDDITKLTNKKKEDDLEKKKLRMMFNINQDINFHINKAGVSEEEKKKYLELREKLDSIKEFDSEDYVTFLEKNFHNIKEEIENVEGLKKIEERINMFLYGLKDFRVRNIEAKEVLRTFVRIKDSTLKMTTSGLLYKKE